MSICRLISMTLPTGQGNIIKISNCCKVLLQYATLSTPNPCLKPLEITVVMCNLSGQSLEGRLRSADVVVGGGVLGFQCCHDGCAGSLVLGLHVSQAVGCSGCVQALSDGNAEVRADIVVDVYEKLGVDRSILA